MDENTKARVMKLLIEARSIVAATPAFHPDAAGVDLIEKAAARLAEVNAVFILACLRDEWVPAKAFKHWASIRKIQTLGHQGKLNVVVKHSRSCCRPSEFFAYFNSLQT